MHPNVERLETFLDPYAARDVLGMRDCLTDVPSIWTESKGDRVVEYPLCLP
jgi:hypothetical protein